MMITAFAAFFPVVGRFILCLSPMVMTVISGRTNTQNSYFAPRFYAVEKENLPCLKLSSVDNNKVNGLIILLFCIRCTAQATVKEK
jgi:hypothetical protein